MPLYFEDTNLIQAKFEEQIMGFRPKTAVLRENWIACLQSALHIVSLDITLHHDAARPSLSSSPSYPSTATAYSNQRGSRFDERPRSGSSSSLAPGALRLSKRGLFRLPPGRNRSLPNRDPSAGFRPLSQPEDCTIRGCSYYGTSVHSHQSYDRAEYDHRHVLEPAGGAIDGNGPDEMVIEEDAQEELLPASAGVIQTPPPSTTPSTTPSTPQVPPVPPAAVQERPTPVIVHTAAAVVAAVPVERGDEKRTAEKKLEKKQAPAKSSGASRSLRASLSPDPARRTSAPGVRILMHPTRARHLARTGSAAPGVVSGRAKTKVRYPLSPVPSPSTLSGAPNDGSPIPQPSASKKPRSESKVQTSASTPTGLASAPTTPSVISTAVSSSSSSIHSSDTNSHAASLRQQS